MSQVENDVPEEAPDTQPLTSTNSVAVASVAKINDDLHLTGTLEVVALKRYLSDQKPIHVHDLVVGEIGKFAATLTTSQLPLLLPRGGDNVAFIAQRFGQYEKMSSHAASLIATLCYWSRPEQAQLAVRALNAIAGALPETPTTYTTLLKKLLLYPTLLTFYAAGIGAVANNRMETLATILLKPQIKQDERFRTPALSLVTESVIDSRMQTEVFGKQFAPFSERIFNALREPLRDVLPFDSEYKAAFDKFEYILTLAFAHYWQKTHGGKYWGPIGHFASYDMYGISGGKVQTSTQEEIINLGKDGPLFKAGIFDGSVDRFKEIAAAIDENTQEYQRSWHYL